MVELEEKDIVIRQMRDDDIETHIRALTEEYGVVSKHNR